MILINIDIYFLPVPLLSTGLDGGRMVEYSDLATAPWVWFLDEELI